MASPRVACTAEVGRGTDDGGVARREGGASGGVRAMIPHLTLAACAAGANGLFMETHPDPDLAPSDGPNMIPLHALDDLVLRAVDVWAAARGRR